MEEVERLLSSILEETIKFNQLTFTEKVEEWKRHNTIPPSFPMEGGRQLFTNMNAVAAFNKLVKILHNENKETKTRISLQTIRSKTQSAIGKTISELKKIPDQKKADDTLIQDAVKLFRSILKRDLDASLLTRQRVVPCHVFSESDEVESFQVGPVTFSPRLSWVRDLQRREKWMEYVDDVWTGKLTIEELERWAWKVKTVNKAAEHAHGVITSFGNRKWAASVKTVGYDNLRSQYKAEILTELALNALGLVMDPADAANLVFAGGERVPLRQNRVSFGEGGNLFLGSSIRIPGVRGSKKSIENFYSRQKSYLASVGKIIQVYADGISQKDRPRLIERWINAIHWHGQAVKEQTDYMALVKYGCALDILTGSAGNINKMSEFVGALFGVDADRNLQPEKKTLREILTAIYQKGRSNLAHGSEFGLLEDLSDERSLAHKISREVLLDATIPLFELVDKSSSILALSKNETKAFIKYLHDRRKKL